MAPSMCRCLFLLLVMLRGIAAGDETTKVAEASSSQVSVAPWKGKTVDDLHAEYYNIFKHGNRNAASHLWSKFLLDRADQMTPERFTYMFTGFCAVSGSPVSPRDGNRWRYNLTTVTGGKHVGYMHHCCWPCICDTQDFIRVDTKTVTLLNGEVKQYHFAVLGNPCDHPEKLTEPWVSPFTGAKTTIAQDAAEVRCDADGKLIGAHLSDHGNIIISMFFDEDPALKFNDESVVASSCKQRAAAGYNSGMGEIFRKVASISPVKSAMLAVDSKASKKPLTKIAGPVIPLKPAADPQTTEDPKATEAPKAAEDPKVAADPKATEAPKVAADPKGGPDLTPVKSAAVPKGEVAKAKGVDAVEPEVQASASAKQRIKADTASLAPRAAFAAAWTTILSLAALH